MPLLPLNPLPGPDLSPVLQQDVPKIATSSSPSDFLGSIRQRPLLVFICALVVFSLGAPFAWIKGKAKYSAETVIYVSPTFIKNLNDDKELDPQYQTFVENYARTVNRFDILADALTKLNEKKRVWQLPNESPQHAAERLAASLEVRHVPETYQIVVDLSADKPDELAEILNAVADSFLEKAHAEQFYGRSERLRALNEERDRIKAQLQAGDARRVELSGALGAVSPGSGETSFDLATAHRRDAMESARKDRVEAEAKLAALESGGTAATNPNLYAQAEEVSLHDPTLSSLKADLTHRKTELLAHMSGLGPQNELRKSAEREIRDIDARLDAAAQKGTETAIAHLRDQQRAEVERTRRIENALSRSFQEQRALTSAYSDKVLQSTELTAEGERLRTRLTSIDDRISYLNLEAQAPGFLRVFSRARTPITPTKGGRKKTFGMLLIAALVFGLAAPVARDKTDNKIRNAANVESVIGFPPVGLILEASAETSAFAEQHFFRLVAGIDRARRATKGKIFVLTAVKPGGGATTLTNSIGNELARQGYKVAVLSPGVGADPAAPMLSSGNESGRAPGGERRPDRLSINTSTDDSRLPSIKRWTSLLEQSRMRYEVVLVDAPPLMFSAEGEVLASMSDGALLVVEADHVDKTELTKAAKMLERLQRPAVGVILNKAKLKSAGYRLNREFREFQANHRSLVHRYNEDQVSI